MLIDLGRLTAALNLTNRARNAAGTLTLTTHPSDDDINDRLREAANHLARAEALLEAVRADVGVWMKEADRD